MIWHFNVHFNVSNFRRHMIRSPRRLFAKNCYIHVVLSCLVVSECACPKVHCFLCLPGARSWPILRTHNLSRCLGCTANTEKPVSRMFAEPLIPYCTIQTIRPPKTVQPFDRRVGGLRFILFTPRLFRDFNKTYNKPWQYMLKRAWKRRTHAKTVNVVWCFSSYILWGWVGTLVAPQPYQAFVDQVHAHLRIPSHVPRRWRLAWRCTLAVLLIGHFTLRYPTDPWLLPTCDKNDRDRETQHCQRRRAKWGSNLLLRSSEKVPVL